MIRILLVDDEPLLLDLTRIFLERPGDIRADTAGSASDALKALRSRRYDAVISDYQMPDMDGITFLKEVRRTYPYLPFIIFTGRSRENVVIEALNNGADFYLQKGGDPKSQFAELEHKLRHAVERKRTARALRESRRKLSTLISNLPGMAYRCKNDRDWTMEFVSEGARELTGYAPSEIINNRLVFFGDLIHPDDRDTVWETVQDALQKRRPFKLVYRLITAGGEERWVWVQGRGVFAPEGEIEALEGLVVNITERKNAEDALRDANRTLHVLVDAIPDAVSFQDAENRYRLVNTAFSRFVGCSKEEIIGKSPEDLLPPELAELCGRIDQDLTDRGLANPTKEHRIETMGETHVYSVTKVPIIGDDGRVSGLVCIGRDFTDARRAEDAMRQMNRKLNLLNNVTRHDVLNQLTVVLGLLHLAEESTNDPLLLDFLGKMDVAAGMVRQQIAFTKDYQEIGIHLPYWQSVCRAFESVRSTVETTGIPVVIDVDPALEVYADPLLEKVFFNILDNACRYGERLTQIRCSCMRSATGIILICEDDGIGVPVTDKERIFSRGFGKNTGFGLFLAGEVLSITGLSIREKGEAGKGARFEIAVPRGAFRIAGKKEGVSPDDR